MTDIYLGDSMSSSKAQLTSQGHIMDMKDSLIDLVGIQTDDLTRAVGPSRIHRTGEQWNLLGVLVLYKVKEELYSFVLLLLFFHKKKIITFKTKTKISRKEEQSFVKGESNIQLKISFFYKVILFLRNSFNSSNRCYMGNYLFQVFAVDELLKNC